MDTASQVLLIIVSATLAIFLIVLSVALYNFISLLNQLRRMVAKAEDVADSVESAADMFKKAASPMMVLKLIANIVEHAGRARRKKG